MVDFVAANTGSDRDKIALAQLKTTASSHMKNLAKRQRGRCRQVIQIAVKIPPGQYASTGRRNDPSIVIHSPRYWHW
jgi:hypothetical protein